MTRYFCVAYRERVEPAVLTEALGAVLHALGPNGTLRMRPEFFPHRPNPAVMLAEVSGTALEEAAILLLRIGFAEISAVALENELTDAGYQLPTLATLRRRFEDRLQVN